LTYAYHHHYALDRLRLANGADDPRGKAVC